MKFSAHAATCILNTAVIFLLIVPSLSTNRARRVSSYSPVSNHIYSVPLILSPSFLDLILSKINSLGLPNAGPSTPLLLPSCPELVIVWENPYKTYPFAIHDSLSSIKAGYDLVSVDPKAPLISFRSYHCRGTSSRHLLPEACSSCNSIQNAVEHTRTRAFKSTAKIDHNALSHEQLKGKLNTTVRHRKTDRLKVFNSVINSIEHRVDFFCSC